MCYLYAYRKNHPKKYFILNFLVVKRNLNAIYSSCKTRTYFISDAREDNYPFKLINISTLLKIYSNTIFGYNGT